MFVIIFSVVSLIWCMGPQIIVAAKYPKTAIFVSTILILIVLYIVAMQEIYGVVYV